MTRFLILSDLEVNGFFSFLEPIITFLESLGHYGLAIYTILEVLLIIPPIEVLYWPLILLDPDKWYLFVINVVFFNILASMIGYYVGKKIGYPILKNLSSDEIVDKAHNLFNKYGVLAVAIGAFTPIPYTIVVFLAGITKMNFKKFIIAGFLGRLPRYLIGGYLVMRIGESDTLQEYMMIVSIVGMVVFIAYYIINGIIKKIKTKKMF